MSLALLCFSALVIFSISAIYRVMQPLKSSSSTKKDEIPTTPNRSDCDRPISPGSSPRTSSEKKTPLERKVRNLRKKAKDVENLMKLQKRGQRLDRDQKGKIRRYDALMAQLRECESELHEEMEERAEIEEEERRTRERAKAKNELMMKVKYDENFTCSICQELLEAATLVDGCSHFFCRNCVLTLMDATTPGKKCQCPLCRNSFEPDNLKPATSVRKKMAKRTGTCHCGQDILLSKMRMHLRSCGAEEGEEELEEQKYHVHQPLSLTRSPSMSARSDYVNADMEELVLQRVLEESRREYEWSSQNSAVSAFA